MKSNVLRSGIVAALGIAASVLSAEQTSGAEPYKILKTTQTMGTGGIDYVYADNDNRRLYVPRGNQVLAFDLDSL